MFRIVVALTNIVLLSSPSLSQDRQGADVASGQLAFNNACRTCHSVKEGDNRLGPARLSEEKQGHWRTMAIPPP